MHHQMPEPIDGASEQEESLFQTRLQSRLDIALTLYEVVDQSIPGGSRLSIVHAACHD